MFQKPDTVTFTFHQKKPDRTGEVKDQDGKTVYTLRDEGDEHELSRYFKNYPFHIERAYNHTKLGTFKYDSDSKPDKWGFIWGSDSPRVGEKAAKRIFGDLVNTDLAFTLPDGTKWEWDGDYHHHYLLFNYQIPSTASVTPGTSAVFTSRYSGTSKFSTLEVSRYEISRPWLLDYLIITCLWLDQSVYVKLASQEAEKIGSEIGSAIADSS
ncbi:hypothetical protein DL96DRAFT_1682571 [Flagelloscypha sp. PMI_526]|nr:hypothetical protein DL96DRAFT_1682571 [Flagelloscypha sp. PMI_526]